MNNWQMFSNISLINVPIINIKFVKIPFIPGFFSYYLLINLLKCFLCIMDLLQFQNLLLQTLQFLYHLQISSYFLHYNASSSKIFFLTVKLMGYIFSAVNVCSNPCVGPFPRTNMSFFIINMS